MEVLNGRQSLPREEFTGNTFTIRMLAEWCRYRFAE